MARKYIDFFHDLFEKENDCVPSFYSKISYAENDSVLYEIDKKDFKNSSSGEKLHFLKYVPSYLKLELRDEKNHTTKKIKDVNGYSIFLKNHTNVEDYLISQFKSKPRSAIRKYIRRLETSFDINYKMFYGSIENEEFDFLYKSLRKMLDKRFEERNGVDINRHKWDKVGENILKLIRQKKASLFVIYDKATPIAITANYHYNDKLFFYGIPSYDIDYSIFRLGHVVIYKELEWCFKNDYLLFETGRGDLDYKKKWCNTVYNFEYHFIYKKGSISSYLLCKREQIKIDFIKYLKKHKVDVLVYKLRKRLKKSSNKSVQKEAINYIIKEGSSSKPDRDYKKIDWTNNTYTFLRRPINEFIYKSVINANAVEAFEILENKEFLIVAGDKKCIIEFN